MDGQEESGEAVPQDEAEQSFDEEAAAQEAAHGSVPASHVPHTFGAQMQPGGRNDFVEQVMGGHEAQDASDMYDESDDVLEEAREDEAAPEQAVPEQDDAASEAMEESEADYVPEDDVAQDDAVESDAQDQIAEEAEVHVQEALASQVSYNSRGQPSRGRLSQESPARPAVASQRSDPADMFLSAHKNGAAEVVLPHEIEEISESIEKQSSEVYYKSPAKEHPPVEPEVSAVPQTPAQPAHFQSFSGRWFGL